MTPKKTKGALKFHQDWEVKYAVQICARDPVSKDVTSVVCLMCTNFGRDDGDAPDRKRKRTSNDKYYTAPWRSDNFVSHLRTQHATMWEEYKKLTHEEKKSFFVTTEAPEAVNLRSFVQPEASVKAKIIAKQKCSFVIDGDIVSKIIADLLLTPAARTTEGGDDADEVLDDDPDVSNASSLSSVARSEGEEGNDNTDELPTNSDHFLVLEKKRILKMFVYNPEDDMYTAKVNSVLKLNLVAKFVAIGVSFRQASKLYHSVKEETGMGSLGSVNDYEVGQLCRIVCAVNLQYYLNELFKKIWAFSIGRDTGNYAGSPNLDIQNLHLVAIPLREQHTGQYQFNLVVTLLDVLAPNWRHQLIGIAIDGASSMTGCIKGTSACLTKECHSQIFQIWCGAHQLDLVMKRAFDKLCNERFLDTLTSVTGRLRCQQNLIANMKSTCPTFVTTWWISRKSEYD